MQLGDGAATNAGPGARSTPDCLCIDELVEIATGRYLGQVFHANDIVRSWDPPVDPAEHRHRLYECFAVMDEDWQAERLRSAESRRRLPS
jgi:hypothetical protein